MRVLRLRAVSAVWIIFCICSVSRAATELGVSSTRFTINGKPAFLLGISYYGALGARDEFISKDLDDFQRDGFNWIRVWATWAAFTNNISALEANGAPREPFFAKLENLIRECDGRGLIVDVTLSRENGRNGGPRLQRLEDHENAVRSLVARLRPYRNWYLDLGNERNIKDTRHVPFEDLQKLRALARKLDPKRLVTASHSSDDESFARDFERYLRDVKVDFLCNHRPRGADSSAQTAAATKLYFDRMQALGVVVPIHCDEPFRRGYTKGWNPTAEDFLLDLRSAFESGAAGWCFHNGAEQTTAALPRRSFDLREKRLYDQLDPVEIEVTRRVGAIVKSP